MQKHEVDINEVYEIVRSAVHKQFHSIKRFGEDEEDLVQEIMVKVYQNWDKFQGDCKVSSWVYRIVKNSIINIAIKHGREKRKTNATYSIEDNQLDFEDENSEIEGIAMHNQRLEMLEALVEKTLNDDEKKVFRGMLKGYSVTKISDVFDLPYLVSFEASKKILALRFDY
jgi:RNA polymerase sigma-70 factor (ECF subfamily)